MPGPHRGVIAGGLAGHSARLTRGRPAVLWRPMDPLAQRRALLTAALALPEEAVQRGAWEALTQVAGPQ